MDDEILERRGKYRIKIPKTRLIQVGQGKCKLQKIWTEFENWQKLEKILKDVIESVYHVLTP